MSAAPPKPLLIAGPTASGKSALALALAERLAAIVVNADALQVYDGFRALTARPDAAALARAPHRLYGHVDPADPGYSVGRWLRELAPILEAAAAAGRRVLIVGGTGLYFRALTRGLAPIPPTDPAVRARIEAEIAAEGVAAAARRLAEADPETAARVDQRNPRRVLRAREVLESTGRGLAAWAAETPAPLIPLEAAIPARVGMARARLRARIRARLEAMIAEGALTEVAALTARGLAWESPAMQALGARALAEHLAGARSLADALEAAALQTGQFAKRQDTWFRNQCGDWPAYPLDAKEDFKDAAEKLAKLAQ